MTASKQVAGSFRDPSGFVFKEGGTIYRQVNIQGRSDYDRLMDSGLYQALTNKALLIPHQQVDLPPADPQRAYLVIQPEPIQFVTYPYEWSFSQLKDAALTTLKIQKIALQHGQSLKDASAYNLQFHRGKPVWIDTLSFEQYEPGRPWVAYRQFCQHYLAPLSIMAYKELNAIAMLKIFLDGLPLDLTSSLLPYSTRLKPNLSVHIHMHARVISRLSQKTIEIDRVKKKMTRLAMLGLIDSLESAVTGLKWRSATSRWSDYYSHTNYSPAAIESKKALIDRYLAGIQPKMVWDLGANTGVFSRVASQYSACTIAMDVDYLAVERNYLQVKKNKDRSLLPLVMDLTNPSPALGWAHQERDSLTGRAPADAVMALALLHHLVIGNNLPLPHIAQYLSELGSWLILEFIPRSDSQIQNMLGFRDDIFQEYTQENFESIFGSDYEIISKDPILDSQRCLYLLKSKSHPPT